MTTILGIDPGLNGAYAIWRDGEMIFVNDLSRFEKSLNAHSFADMLRSYHVDFAMIEEVHAMPKQGVSSTFTFGRAYGVLEGILGALKIPHQHVKPRVWQKRYGLTARTSSLEKAIRLFPERLLSLTHKKDHNRADAMLIADYAVHVYKELRENV
jgi:crossover junction endodeoxyribonuclease RuvC